MPFQDHNNMDILTSTVADTDAGTVVPARELVAGHVPHLTQEPVGHICLWYSLIFGLSGPGLNQVFFGGGGGRFTRRRDG